MAQKIIRDPVHDVIAFQMNDPLDALLFSLLGSQEFQRLRRISQLGMAHLAYPGATHTRLSHCLGVLETARQILFHIGTHTPISEESKTVCLVSALLHDLGHGPFSHVFERVSGISHERLTLRLIRDPDSQAHRILWQHDRLLPEKTASFFRAERRTFLNDVISSQLDADRFDYLLRDNLHTGSRYGAFDLKWLLHALTIDQFSDRLAVAAKGTSAIEDYLHARYNMYRNVYFHKVVRSAEGMVKLALRRARRLAIQDRLAWPLRDDPMHKALMGQRLTVSEFVDLDDIAASQCLKVWSRSEDAALARLCHGLLFRAVYKTIDVSEAAAPRQLYEKAQEAIRAAGGDPDYDLFYDEPADTPYGDWDDGESSEGAGILVQDPAGRVTPFSQISPLPRALSRRLMFRRIHVSPEYREAAGRAVEAEGRR